LLPGIRVMAGLTIYQYNSNHVSVNTDGTELTIPLDINSGMFPTWGEPSPRLTPIFIYFEGRYGAGIEVNFN